MVWGWLVTSVFTMIVAVSMAEICSTYPQAGSVYYWAGALGNKHHQAFASYLTGWLNYIAYIAMLSGFAFGNAKIIVGFMNVDSEGTKVIIGIIILFIWCAQNMMKVDVQGWTSGITGTVHLFAGLIVVISIFFFSQKLSTTEYVFTEYINETGFNE